MSKTQPDHSKGLISQDESTQSPDRREGSDLTGGVESSPGDQASGTAGTVGSPAPEGAAVKHERHADPQPTMPLGARPMMQQFGDELDVKFWASVLSNTLSGLITAWAVFLVGSTVAVAALGADGSNIRWTEGLAVASLCVLLGITLIFGFWNVFSLLLPPPTRPPSYLWILVLVITGAMAITGWESVPGSAAPVAFQITLVITLFLVFFGAAVRALDMKALRPRTWRALHISGAVLSLVGTVTSGISVGVALARAAM